MNWLQFLRHYGPVPRNDNMYDETIQRSAKRTGISPIAFEHPLQSSIIQCFERRTIQPTSVILTGTAGDGKTHLCRQVWGILGGPDKDWASDDPYLSLAVPYSNNRSVQVHFIRDLSGWAPQQGTAWEPEKAQLLQKFCHSLFGADPADVFLIAANDGQLIESWRRLPESDEIKKTQQLLEDLLVEDRQEQQGVHLKFFNLSRARSTELFDRTLDALLLHPGWEQVKQGAKSNTDLFGPNCPVRQNFELLQTPLVRSRLRALLELCDYNGLHVPIRQILLLLTNAILGHPDAKDHLITPADVPKIIAAGTTSKASLYGNVFGANLSEIRRQTITIFDYLERFQIGYETSNLVDNILIFGEGDEHLGAYFDEFVAKDRFYGADARFYAAKQQYIEGAEENEDKGDEFLEMLISQRRGLFFKIPKTSEIDLRLWELTVFKFAGEYLDAVVEVLRRGMLIKRPILSRLVKGLNRVFTGMLVNSDRELYLATSGNYSQAKISRILRERVSVEPSKGEKVTLAYDAQSDKILLSVFFAPDLKVDFNVTLIRYEFLSRIALDGALPASFSKECYEDLLAFKSQLIAALSARESRDQDVRTANIGLNLFSLTEEGMPDPRFVEIVR